MRAWRYQQWGGLGRSVDDMSAREVACMQACLRVFDTVRRFSAAENVVDMARRDPDGWRLMSWIRANNG